MHADSAYVIGHGHKVCQDYARHGRINGLDYAIVSDGCSSSPDTDIGARLLVLTTELNLQYCSEQGFTERAILDISRHALYAAGFPPITLDPRCLDATLLVAVAWRDAISILAGGDGVIACLDQYDHVAIWDIEAPDNHPRYPNYLNDIIRRKIVESGQPWTVSGPDGVEMCTPKVEAFYTAFTGQKVVAVFSDGVKSFVDADRKPIPFEAIVRELLDFKYMTGQFVQRRMQKFLKAAAQRGWQHFDDLSMAAIYTGKEDD